MATIELSPRESATLEMMAREAAIVERLVSSASTPLDWLAVERQAHSFRRHLEPWFPFAAKTQIGPEMHRHDEWLSATESAAGAQLGSFEAAVVAEARAQLGLRLAFIGKGGAGKTVLASTLSRLLARRGRRVFAADLDTNPGLAISLGLGTGDFALPAAVVEEREGSNYGWRLSGSVTPEEAVEHHATIAPDGVHFLGLGKIGSTDKVDAKQSVVALTQILLGFADPRWDVVADLEAGPTTPFERYHAFAEDVAIVVGPSWVSALTARRLLPMVEDRRGTVVANRFRDEPDHPGLAPVLRIPFDAEVAAAEREGRAPLDACPDSPVIAAVGELLDFFLPISKEVQA